MLGAFLLTPSFWRLIIGVCGKQLTMSVVSLRQRLLPRSLARLFACCLLACLPFFHPCLPVVAASSSSSSSSSQLQPHRQAPQPSFALTLLPVLKQLELHSSHCCSCSTHGLYVIDRHTNKKKERKKGRKRKRESEREGERERWSIYRAFNSDVFIVAVAPAAAHVREETKL